MQTTVFFDGRCPLCLREISHYQRMDHAQKIRWVDIWENEPLLKTLGLTLEQTMRVFHVLDRSGELKTGAYGFVEVWQQLPYYRWLGRGVQHLRLTTPLNWLYHHFARWRYRSRCKTCNLD